MTTPPVGDAPRRLNLIYFTEGSERRRVSIPMRRVSVGLFVVGASILWSLVCAGLLIVHLVRDVSVRHQQLVSPMPKLAPVAAPLVASAVKPIAAPAAQAVVESTVAEPAAEPEVVVARKDLDLQVLPASMTRTGRDVRFAFVIQNALGGRAEGTYAGVAVLRAKGGQTRIMSATAEASRDTFSIRQKVIKRMRLALPADVSDELIELRVVLKTSKGEAIYPLAFPELSASPPH